MMRLHAIAGISQATRREAPVKAWQQRRAFTLIEMMVSVALVLLIMVILSSAFATALESFRILKGIGDMEQRLRSVTIILRKDLASNHFEGNKRLSDEPILTNFPPQQGFFRIYQGSASVTEGADGDSVPSSVATNHLLHFTVRRDGNQRTNFFFADVSRENLALYPWPTLVTPPPPYQRYQDLGTFSSQWMEVAYFLRANGANANGTTLYTLYRRQRLAIPSSTAAATVNTTTPTPASRLTDPVAAPAYAEISCLSNPNGSGNIYFNYPGDSNGGLTIPQNRFNMNPAPSPPNPPPNGDGGQPLRTDGTTDGTYSILSDSTGPAGGPQVYLYTPIAGADALLTDVLSFDVQVYYTVPSAGAENSGDFVDVPASPGPGSTLTANPLYSSAGGPFVYDTWSTATEASGGTTIYNYSTSTTTGGTAATMPLAGISIKAVRVTIRIWDQRTQQARQVTIIQDM